jgi:hypothetical protein
VLDGSFAGLTCVRKPTARQVLNAPEKIHRSKLRPLTDEFNNETACVGHAQPMPADRAVGNERQLASHR